MPFHIQPALRAREEAMEAAGILQKINTVAVTNALAAEAQGLVAKPIPVGHIHYFAGTQYIVK